MKQVQQYDTDSITLTLSSLSKGFVKLKGSNVAYFQLSCDFGFSSESVQLSI